MFFFYQSIVLLIIIFSPIILLIRILKKKEDKIRFKEKFCFFSKNRDRGNLIWFHGSSVGEVLSIMPLVKKLEKNTSIKKILITSSTLSSATITKRFKFKKTIHQFFPIDLNFLTNKFLDYWKPTVAIFIESEIWPSMFLNIKKKSIPLILINARITKKTFNKWIKLGSFCKNIFSKIDFAYPQNLETLKYLKKLEVNKIKLIGNLKFTENKNDRLDLLEKSFIQQLKNRKLWCASSTHADEELICAKVHFKLKKKYKNLLTIIIPRHIHRVDEIKNKIKSLGLKIISRSSNKKILKDLDVFLVDTYGETKQFYNIANPVFLGGSFIKHGGQNPIEPARLGSQIIHGPNVDNFKEVYKLFNNKRISHKVKNIQQFTKIVDKLINTSKRDNNKFIEIKKIGKTILDKSTQEINNIVKNEIKKT